MRCVLYTHIIHEVCISTILLKSLYFEDFDTVAAYIGKQNNSARTWSTVDMNLMVLPFQFGQL